MNLTLAQQKYFAYWLTRSLPSDSLGKLTASLQDAQVDLTPHQIDAAPFAFKSPLSKGAATLRMAISIHLTVRKLSSAPKMH